jgi:hypothetical protein
MNPLPSEPDSVEISASSGWIIVADKFVTAVIANHADM